MKRDTTEWPLRYLTADADLGDPSVVERVYSDLEGRTIDNPYSLEGWLLDWSEVDAWLDEEGSTRYVAMTCQTDDAAREKSYLDFIEQVVPVAKAWGNKLDRKFLGCSYRGRLPLDRFGTLIRRIENRVALFREENIPLQTEDDKLRQQYQKLVGCLSANYDGKERTMQEMARYLEQTDRHVRQETWALVADKWRAIREEVEGLYDAMIKVRHRIALNAGSKNYRDHAFRELERFDYTPADCTAFAESIEQLIVPAARRLAEKRKAGLKLETLRPWDMAVDPDNRAPLRPFENAQRLIEGCGRIFSKVLPTFGEQFERMRAAGLLDLESRKGKAPGGYMTEFKGRRLPFIFMNAVGTHDDVQTMLHEGGHAFHAFAARDESVTALRDTPIEFAEVASMGMEMIAGKFLEEFYAPDDAARAWRDHLEGVVKFFPYMATIDQLQHWAYTNPQHTREERKAAWLGLNRRFGGWVDYRGHEDVLEFLWHRKGHPFTVPFYYVEYGIAQLGALGVWLNSTRDYPGAVAAYRGALALGGRRPLPALFGAAGVKFDFSSAAIGPAVAALEQALN